MQTLQTAVVLGARRLSGASVCTRVTRGNLESKCARSPGGESTSDPAGSGSRTSSAARSEAMLIPVGTEETHQLRVEPTRLKILVLRSCSLLLTSTVSFMPVLRHVKITPLLQHSMSSADPARHLKWIKRKKADAVVRFCHLSAMLRANAVPGLPGKAQAPPRVPGP